MNVVAANPAPKKTRRIARGARWAAAVARFEAAKLAAKPVRRFVVQIDVPRPANAYGGQPWGRSEWVYAVDLDAARKLGAATLQAGETMRDVFLASVQP